MDKKEIIIRAAGERFKYYGISKTTMQEIANDANMAVGTLYLYFKNKNEIFIACADEFAKIHKIQAQNILDSKLNVKEKIKKYLIERFKASKETRIGFPHAVELTKAILKYYPSRLEEEGKWLYENILFIVKEGIEKGEFKSDNPEKDVEVLMYSLISFFPFAGQKEPDEEKFLMIIDWFISLWSK